MTARSRLVGRKTTSRSARPERWITPYKGKNKPGSQKDANRAHARLRGPGERVNAQLKCRRILYEVRVSPRGVGRLAKAIHVLQNYEATAGRKRFVGWTHPTAAMLTVRRPSWSRRADRKRSQGWTVVRLLGWAEARPSEFAVVAVVPPECVELRTHAVRLTVTTG